MPKRPIHPQAAITLAMSALFMAAEAFCSIFVSVYLWVNSHDFSIVCWHYLTVFGVTPIFFVIAGGLAQRYDRTWVYRVGVVLSVAFYATLLALGPNVPEYAIPLGVMLGVAWGFFFAGLNTLNYDMSVEGGRELYIGMLMGVVGVAQLISPMVAAFVVAYAPDEQFGYRILFGAAVALYGVNALVSFFITPDHERKPYRVVPALFPPRHQRDWRLVMFSTLTMAGAYNIFTFLLAVIMFMESDSALNVGGLASLQALVGIIASVIAARYITRARRRNYMIAGAMLLAAGGLCVIPGITIGSLIALGILRAAAEPLFGVPATGIRFDIIANTINHPSERTAYVCAWEVPLGIGRVIMMAYLATLYYALPEDLLGLRIGILTLACLRIVTVLILLQTDVAKQDRLPLAKPAE